MFAYVKYTDGEKHIVPANDIKHFKADQINFFKKYKIKWNDEYYEGVIICVGDTVEEVNQKMQKRLRVPPFERCESASESESTPKPRPREKVNDDEAIRSIIDKKVDHVLRDDANLKKKEGSVTENARRMMKPTNKTGAVRKENAEKTIPGKKKDNVTDEREVGNSTNRNNLEHKENTLTTAAGKNKKDHVTVVRDMGKSTNRNNPEREENVVTTAAGKNKKDHVTVGRDMGKSTNRNNPERKENTVTTVAGKQKKHASNTIESANKNNFQRKENAVTTMTKKTEEDVTSKRGLVQPIHKNNAVRRENAAKENGNNPAASTNAEREKSNREIKLLRDVIDRLKNSMRDKDKAYADLLKLNVELQREILNNFAELKLIVGDMQRRIGDRTDTNVGLLPVGYIRRETEMIHLGRDIWIGMGQWDTILSVCRTPTQFAKQMATTVFGSLVLKNSTVTGQTSNRKKKDKNSAPARPRLNPTKLLAIKDIFLYWLTSVMHLDEVSADLEASRLGEHISHKICDLNRPIDPNKKNKTASARNASAKAKPASKIAGSRRTDAVENSELRVCDASLDEHQQDVHEPEQKNGNAEDIDDEILFRQSVPSPHLSITDDERESPPSTPQENEDAHETNDKGESRPSTPLRGEKIGRHESDDELEFRSRISEEEEETVDNSDDETQFPPLRREINRDADDADSETQFEGGISAHQLNDKESDAQLSDDMFSDY